MKYFLLSISLLFLQIYSFAQNDLVKADAFYNSGEFSDAIPIYKKHLENNERDSLAMYRIGMSYINSNDLKTGITFLEKAVKLNFYQGYTYGQIAKFSAALKDNPSLYRSLDSLLKYNPGNFALIKKDTTFDSYLNIPQFKEKVELMAVKSYPCLTNEKSRLFDFWIGEWNVIASGRTAGINIITRANGGCVIHESHTTSGAYLGQSINFLDPEDNLWKQYWVGSSGDVYSFNEIESENGKLIFLAKSKVSGTETWTRLSFTHNSEKDEVSQIFECSTDSGETWKTGFNGLYQKIKPI